MPTKKIDAEASKREAFRLYEEVNEYFLSWALDGEFFIEDMTRAKAAFDTMDVGTLRKLCDEYRCDVEFIEAGDALKAHLPRMKPILDEKTGKLRKFKVEDYSQSDRMSILPTIPGTRAYARVQIEAQGNGTPFDA